MAWVATAFSGQGSCKRSPLHKPKIGVMQEKIRHVLEIESDGKMIRNKELCKLAALERFEFE